MGVPKPLYGLRPGMQVASTSGWGSRAWGSCSSNDCSSVVCWRVEPGTSVGVGRPAECSPGKARCPVELVITVYLRRTPARRKNVKECI